MRPPAPPGCPNPGCVHHAAPPKNFFWRKGTFTPKRTGVPLVRYQCKGCRRTFSNRTFAADRGQHRPDINGALAALLCSGVTMRRAALLLGVAYNTVCARLPWLAEQARKAHGKALADGVLSTSYLQFDEMETFVGASPKAVTIAVAVRAKTGQILSVRAGRIPSKGRLAKKGQLLYGWTVDQGPATCAAALQEAARAAKAGATVASDGKSSYANLIAGAIPGAAHQPSPANAALGGFDPLFALNHVCAKIRADLSRMARRTWATTKSIARLQDHLDLYVAWQNRYRVG